LWIVFLSPALVWNSAALAATEPPEDKPKEEKAPADKSGGDKTPATPKDLVGSHVDIHLKSGKTLKGVLVEEATPGKLPGSVVKLKYSMAEGKLRPPLSAGAIKEVTSEDGSCCLVFDVKSKSLVPPDRTQAPLLEPPASAKKSGRANAAHGKKGADAEADSAEDAARRERNEARRKDFLQKTGVNLWPELTDAEKKENIEKDKAFIRKVADKYPSLKLRLQETKYFLFLSDLSPQVAAVFTSSLDDMHENLCKSFAVADQNKVWLGKAPVVAFSQPEYFAQFEQDFFQMRVDPREIQGLAHQSPDGDVVIGCHCGKDPYYFAGVLVHETTHGFVHRHLSSVPIPSWLNEGIAEWSAMTTVAKDQGVRGKVKKAIAQMRQTGTLGGNFFSSEHIASAQYGMATAITDYLLRNNPKAFRSFVEGIKLGEKWETSLQKSYGLTPEQLTQQFGRTIGIPMLRP
jgi:hypothetical protein